jgi:hypothetical protein
MRSRQRERRVVVIERRIRPRDSVMTKLAGGREARVRHRTFRIVEIILVARNAERAIQVVVIVHVAVRARPRRNRMGTRQRETGLRVIELAIRPLDCVMAILASRREASVRHWTFRIVVVGLVATDAGGRQRDVVVVDVAVGARPRRHHMRARQREWGVVVIEGRIRPGRRVMAHLASRREARVRHRTVCSGEIFLVARNAQRAVQVVVVVDVAVRARARGNSVTARQRETSLRVIELSIRPLHGVMTLFAGGREAGVRHRTLRIVVVGLVARNASGIGNVVVVDTVAVRARPWRHGVRSGEGKRGLGMVERCRLPRRSGMADFATLREASRHMVRILRAGEVGLVASYTRRARQAVVVLLVAIRALPRRYRMHSRQGETGHAVVELPVRPRNRVVTRLTVRGETLVRHRAGRVVVISLVARNTSRAREVEGVVDVAIRAGAGRNRVPPSQRESHRVVIELRIQPVVRSVALFAGSRVSEGDVIRGRGLLEVRFMAGKARRGHGLELAVGRVLVAGIAIDGRVSAGQGEAIIVLLNLLDRHAPSAHAVALLAICTEFALMNVGVAVLAAGARVAEYRLHVALCARHVLVKAAQRVTGLVVIKFGKGADRLPAIRCVTVLAGNIQIAVWAMSSRGALVRPARKRA